MKKSAILFVEPLEDRRLLSATLVRDVLEGVGSARPSDFANVGGTLFFSANNGEHGDELWKSDGTEEGTVLVKDVRPGPRGSSPRRLTAVGDRVFFVANYDLKESTAELWVSDGSEKGTGRVRDFSPGEMACILLDQLTEFNGALVVRYGWYPSGQFCEKGPPTLNFSLWISDGTEKGTTPFATATNLNEPVVIGDALFFGAYSAANRREQLWRSDGTPDGTQLVTEQDTGGRITRPSELTNVNGRLFFVGGFSPMQSLWTSDGTEKGTLRLLETPSSMQELTASADTLFFAAPHPELGAELWRSDGTPEGTFVVRDINPFGGSLPLGLTDVAGTLFFSANDGEHGRELWQSDGTEKGTRLVWDIRPGPDGAIPQFGPTAFVAAGATLYFAADDGKYGRELWRSDGTEEGTFLVEDVSPGATGSLGTQNVRPFLTTVGDRVFFAANDGSHGVELWVTASYGGPLEFLDGQFLELLQPRPGRRAWSAIGRE